MKQVQVRLSKRSPEDVLIERKVRRSKEDIEGWLASKRGTKWRYLVEEALFGI